MFSLKLFFNLWLITCCQIYASVRFEFHHFQPTSIVFNENMRPQKKKLNYPQTFLLDSHTICFAFPSTRAANTDTIAAPILAY